MLGHWPRVFCRLGFVCLAYVGLGCSVELALGNILLNCTFAFDIVGESSRGNEVCHCRFSCYFKEVLSLEKCRGRCIRPWSRHGQWIPMRFWDVVLVLASYTEALKHSVSNLDFNLSCSISVIQNVISGVRVFVIPLDL
ncbi:hypothetical protein TB2_029088 [Malus domestica]